MKAMLTVLPPMRREIIEKSCEIIAITAGAKLNGTRLRSMRLLTFS
jgi:hypothetical protein